MAPATMVRAPARSALVGHGDILAPPEFAEAVEQYARKNDRHATMRFMPPINCWQIEFTLRASDPALKAWKEGMAKEEPKEIVQLWDYVTSRPQGREPLRVTQLRRNAMRRGMKLDCYIGYKLMDLGVSGVIQFLEEGNTWGRGQYKSHGDAVKEQMDKRAEGEAKIAADAKQNAVERGMDKRRQVLKIPYHGVGIDLQKGPESAPGDAK